MSHDQIPRLTDPENARSWRLTKAGIFALIALGAIGWLIVDQRRAAREQELPKSGLPVQGKVLELDSRRGGQNLTLSYEFKVNGTPVEIRKRRVGDHHGLAPGGPVAVWYDPADPLRCVTSHELHHARFGWTPYLYGGAIVILMGLAAFQAWKVLQPARETTME